MDKVIIVNTGNVPRNYLLSTIKACINALNTYKNRVIIYEPYQINEESYSVKVKLVDKPSLIKSNMAVIELIGIMENAGLEAKLL